jgi:acyl-coenzyme A synthetase/AMP-(fatty) acid ligase
VSDKDLGEAVAAFVVKAEQADAADIEAALRARAQTALAAYKRPRVYHFLSELPRNAMGKIERGKLQQAFSSSQSAQPG